MELETLLRSHGHRVTRARVAVWDALQDVEGHPTVDDLAAHVAEREPGTNVASVYRALSLFEELGLARASRLGDDEGARWEVAHPDDTIHLVCDVCGSVTHHTGDLVDQVRTHLHEGHGFEPSAVDLTVTGTCARCATSG